jgi:hypothetical protein
MHTVKSLKAEYKTLATAKAAHGIRANSWQALADKINPPLNLQQRVQELEAENLMLRQQLASLSKSESSYFVSSEAAIIYSVIELDGEPRLKALGINKTHYRDTKKAKEWRNNLAMQIHPDKCAHPLAGRAMDEVTAIYESMVA